MTEMTIEEIKQEETKLLVWFAEYCDKHNLKYSLAYGTFLGAVRHHGFIPWDDDIDVMMPREDYNKFLKCFSEIDSGWVWPVHPMTDKRYPYPFIKLVSKRTYLVEKRLKPEYRVDGMGIWVDIFPVDYVHSREDFLKVVSDCKLLGNMIYQRTPKHWIKRVTQPLWESVISAVRPDVSALVERIDKEAQADPSDKMGISICGEGLKEIFSASVWNELEEYSFEGYRLKGLKCYDMYLSQLYGDYMQLPPEDERPTHNFEAWWR